MYNRYVPQNDGSYRRNRMTEALPSPPPEPPKQQQTQQEIPIRQASLPPRPHRKAEPQSPLAFFRQLLPRDFDTEDLMIVLLLLLMSGDCKQDQNNALLTLALYLFL